MCPLISMSIGQLQHVLPVYALGTLTLIHSIVFYAMIVTHIIIILIYIDRGRLDHTYEDIVLLTFVIK